MVLLALAAGALFACAPARTIYVKPGVSRDTVTIDALDCSKAGVIARRDYLARRKDRDTIAARQAASAFARAAVHRCAMSKGYKRVR